MRREGLYMLYEWGGGGSTGICYMREGGGTKLQSSASDLPNFLWQ